jgi:hypothetical protein
LCVLVTLRQSPLSHIVRDGLLRSEISETTPSLKEVIQNRLGIWGTRYFLTGHFSELKVKEEFCWNCSVHSAQGISSNTSIGQVDI